MCKPIKVKKAKEVFLELKHLSVTKFFEESIDIEKRSFVPFPEGQWRDEDLDDPERL